jgi:hypothetical protein
LDLCGFADYFVDFEWKLTKNYYYRTMPVIKKTKVQKSVFPPEEELERIRKRIARSDKRTNFSLAP